jgi:hypothetical protein
MKSTAISLIGALALAAAALGQQPPDVVVSDAYCNTAMGSGALLNNMPGSVLPFCGAVGNDNTASGFDVLYSNTTGKGNTASGSHALYSNTIGYQNVAMGDYALYFNTNGPFNTAIGGYALYDNTSGNSNTAVGYTALAPNTTGSNNTALGVEALGGNFTGSYNTAGGVLALWSNSTGSNNTAVGNEALLWSTTGSNNTVVGYQALQGFYPSTGSYNTGIGEYALFSSSTGSYNVALGVGALNNNTTGQYNTASGMFALYGGETGVYNTATGYGALYNAAGRNNTAFGFHAGFNLTTGSNNIEISNPGVARDTDTIRIGVQGTQTLTYVAGIYGHPLTGSAVVVTSSGELGVLSSSERFKTAISPMGSDTAKLGRLRPVTFKLKTDVTGTRQYGLIAEEVAKVYPELVIRNETGRIDGVRYDELAPMLLNELQKQAAEIRALKAQARVVARLQKQLVDMQAVLVKVQSKDALVAQR